MAVDTPRLALGQLVFEQGFQQTLLGPTLAVLLRTQLWR
jgi:hypothetical protein